jgi:hypothetical protein
MYTVGGGKNNMPSCAATARKANRNLTKAKEAKQDEFYTQLTDIEKELKHYRKHFRGKTVYCNCDDPKVSNFFEFFNKKFTEWGLKRLITTCYKNDNPDLFSRGISKKAKCLDWDGKGEPKVLSLEGDGDFRSEESIALLEQADIVVTNPPFSLFREYVALLVEHKKKFIIVGNLNSITYKDIFPLIRDNKVWLGYNCTRWFMTPDGSIFEAARSFWYTNLDTAKRHEDIILYKKYSPSEYPTYVNYDAIEVGKTADIPMDYDGAMGVPITFLDKYNPDQFEIVGSSRTLATPMSEVVAGETGKQRFYLPNSNGTYRRLYDRIIIKNKKVGA